jgi:hypothetical protein
MKNVMFWSKLHINLINGKKKIVDIKHNMDYLKVFE